jgi:hypothetical protein
VKDIYSGYGWPVAERRSAIIRVTEAAQNPKKIIDASAMNRLPLESNIMPPQIANTIEPI